MAALGSAPRSLAASGEALGATGTTLGASRMLEGQATIRPSARRLAPIASPGKRASDRVAQKNRLRAAEIRKERDERTHKHLARAPKGDGGAHVATQAQLVEMSEIMNKRMIELFIDPGERSWYKFFVHMDDDCSGKISYEELVDMVRNELMIAPSKFSDPEMQALWLALDEDHSGLISAGEFGHFMRLGQHIHSPAVPWKERRDQAAKESAAAVRTQQEELLQDLKKRLAAEQEARQRKASDAYNSIWGSTMSGSAFASTSTTSATSALSARGPWRSPRALIF